MEMKEIIPSSDTEALLLKKLGAEPVHIDEICRASGLPMSTVSSTLAMMELKGMVKQVGTMNYSLCREAREKYIVEMGFKGLKLYPTYQHFFPNQNDVYPIYEKALELNIPVMFHTGSSIYKHSKLKYGDPLYLDEVAADFPDLKIVMAHSGRGFWYDKAFFISRIHKNLYMEISGLPPQKLLHYFPDLEK